MYEVASTKIYGWMGEKKRQREGRRKREIRAFNDKWGCIRTLFSSLLLFIIVLEALSIKNSGKVIYRNLP